MEQLTFEWLQNAGHRGTCLHGVCGRPEARALVAAFDVDQTIIDTKSESVFPKDEYDWVFLYENVPAIVRGYYERGYAIVFLSNQNYASSTKPLRNFQRKLKMVAEQINVPLQAFAATNKDKFRKPCPGMWEVFTAQFNGGVAVDLDRSFYVGDAAGRLARPRSATNAQIVYDFSDSDRKMAFNVNLPFFTPEEVFLQAPPDTRWAFKGFNAKQYILAEDPHMLPMVQSLTDALVAEARRLVILVGAPLAGKTTFRERFLRGGHVATLKTPLSQIDAWLRAGALVVVDDTLPSARMREPFLRVAAAADVPAVCIHMTSSIDLCTHNSKYRACVPPAAPPAPHPMQAYPMFAQPVDASVDPFFASHSVFSAYAKQFQPPSAREGFSALYDVPFLFRGNDIQMYYWRMWFT